MRTSTLRKESSQPLQKPSIVEVIGQRVTLLARRGEIPFLNIDGRMRFDAKDIEDWLRYQRSDAPTLPGSLVDVTPHPNNGGRNVR